MSETQKLDIVVIGAGLQTILLLFCPRLTTILLSGWHGLVAAKTYLDVNPTANLALIESESTVGGVWAKSRLYPGLKTNNLLGAYEYPDFPIDKEKYGVTEGRPLPADVVHRYLTDYSKEFGIYERIHFDSKVESAEHQEAGGWLLTISGRIDGQTQLFTSKLIVATGLTSDPFLPIIKGSESFNAALFHSKDFKDQASTVDTMTKVCVLGGTKSAWDVVYAYASRGVQVDWIIRESGHGPTWMSPPYVTPLKKWLEKLTQTRLLTWFSPCIWADPDRLSYIRSLFHGTWLGRKVVDTFWGILAGDVISLNQYDSHPETAKLKPWTSPFFIASGLSILNYDTNFFDLIKEGKARVHIADITNLDDKSVNLSNGEKLETDALICCTGWKHSPPIKFLPKGIDLGLPHRRSLSEPSALIAKADQEILNKFPRLKDQPKPNPKYQPMQDVQKTPEHEQEGYRLYRFMIPPAFMKSRDIAFAGSLLTIATSANAQIQALWIAAFFANEIHIDSDVNYTTILHSRFGKWRAPGGFGHLFPDMVFDAVSHHDMLLKDLGLRCYRKTGFVAEILDGYGPADYKGLTGEWLEKKRAGKVHVE